MNNSAVEKQLNTIKALAINSDFLKEVDIVRKEFSLPVPSDNTDHPVTESKEVKERVWKSVYELGKKYGVVPPYTAVLYGYIVDNFMDLTDLSIDVLKEGFDENAFNVIHKEIEVLETKDLIDLINEYRESNSDYMNPEKRYPVSISIPANISKSELCSYISDNYEREIEPLLKKHLGDQDMTNKVKFRDPTRLKRDREVLNLLNTKFYSPKDVTRIINSSYDRDFHISESYVRKLRSLDRFK